MERYADIQICAFCKKQYRRVREEQILGHQEVDYDICPYCITVNRVSKKWNFYNTKMAD